LAHKKTSTVQIKIRFKPFRTITRQISLETPTNSDRQLIAACFTLLEREKLNVPIRLLGFGTSNLISSDVKLVEQAPTLFDMCSNKPHKDEELDKAVDKLVAKYGAGAITRVAPHKTSEPSKD
jgi:hypothetical protein